MIDFVGAPKFLEIIQWVAMETMRFHIAIKVCFNDNLFCTKAVLINTSK